MPEPPRTTLEFLSAETVAHQLDVKPVTIYRWCRDGRLRCLKLGKSWRIRQSDLDAFLRQSEGPETLTGHLDRFLMTPDQLLTVAEDADLLMQFDAAFFRIGTRHDAVLIKFYDPQTTSRSALQAGLQRHGLGVEALQASGRLRWCAETSLEAAVASLQQIESEERGETPIWALFNWPSVGEMEAKLRQQVMLADLIKTHPRLVVSTGVVEPEPAAWPPLAEQWQLLGSLRGLIRFARASLLLSRVVRLPPS